MKPTLLQRDTSGWIGHVGDVLLNTYKVPASLELMRQRHRIEVQFMERTKPKKYVVGTVVLAPAITNLSPELRDINIEHTKTTAPHTRAGTLVMIAPGFKAAMIRGFLGTLLLVTGAGFPFKVAATHDEGFEFLGPHLDAPLTIDDVKRAWHELDAAT